MSQAVALPIDEAPTTLDEMSKVGRFNLRLWALELGMSEEEKSSYMQLSNDEQAKVVLAKVLKYKAEKAKSSASSTASRSPSTKTKKNTEKTQSNQQEDPALTRSPVVSKGNTGGGATGPSSAINSSTSPTAGAVVVKEIKNLCEKISKEGTASSSEILNSINNLAFALWFNTSITLLQVEHTLSGQISRGDIIAMALGDIPTIENAIVKRRPPVEVEEEEGFQEEGNE